MRASNHAFANRLRQRGAGQWPFIITLLLLLVFVYLWWSVCEERDNAAKKEKAAIEKENKAKALLGDLATQAAAISAAVGWDKVNFPLQGMDPDQRPTIALTDVKKVKEHTTKDGSNVVEGQEPQKGTLNFLLTEAVLKFTREGRVHAEKIGAETPIDYSELSQAFKDKLDEFSNTWGGENSRLRAKPVQPTDPDDQEAMAQYRQDQAEYEKTLGEYDAALKELTDNPDWREYSDKIAAPGQWDDPTTAAIEVSYYSFPEGGEETIENVLKGIPAMVRGFQSEAKAIASSYADKVQQLQADNTAKQTAWTEATETLAREQSDFTTQLNRLTGELAASQAKVTALTDEKNQAQNDLQQAKDDHKVAIRKVSADRDSYREGLANMKERRALRFRRDLAKGMITAASQALRSGTIDKGTADRIYVGQKFQVSSTDGGGNRVNKGEILITEVNGKHSASFRITSQVLPITGGDKIHNPLYNPTDPIHVYIYGTLDKWPRTLVESRLKPLGVVVQSEINGDTDYIVIPNSLGVKPAAPADGEEDEDEGEETAGSSPLEKLENRARRSGAVVISERLFDSFLDY